MTWAMLSVKFWEQRRRRRIGVVASVLAMVASLAGCTATGRDGTSSSFVIVDSLLAASGAKPSTFGGSLPSDVQTYVKVDVNGQQVRVPTVFEDLAQVTLRLALKDPGTVAQPSAPSSINYVTVRGYHVWFVRSDGRKTHGVDVPYPFDGAMTVTVRDTPVSASFVLVRVQAKREPPLSHLVGGGGAGAISTIAEVTFYGHDQTGRAVSVKGQISVDFADYADPD